MKTIVKSLLLFLILFTALSYAQVIRSAGIKGDWNSTATWVGGAIPGAGNDVVIVNGDSVHFNKANGEVKSIKIGENAAIPTALLMKNDADYTFTVHGNIEVSGDSAKFIVTPNNTAVRNHTLNLEGNLTSNGTIDFKTGSSPNNGFLKVVFVGTNDSYVKVNPFVITPSTVNEWGGITINKTGSAKVILQSDIGMSNVSSVVLTLTNGIIKTGPYYLGVYGTGSGSVAGGSQESYVWGRLGRGWASSGTVNNKIFPIGDSLKYRPVWVSNTLSSYHLAICEVVEGNANTGSSSLLGGIDKVSAVRYYKCTAGLVPRSGTIPSPFTLTKVGIGYYEDDGVAAGNTNLRVAFAQTNRNNWTSWGPLTHLTTVGTTPTQFTSDSVKTTIQLDSVFYFALARVTGTTENSLGTATSVEDNQIVNGYSLMQNYPNPFNPSTEIGFTLPARDFVSLKVFNSLGEEIATLVDDIRETGYHSVNFNAEGLNSGVYFYQIKTSSFTRTAKMTLMK